MADYNATIGMRFSREYCAPGEEETLCGAPRHLCCRRIIRDRYTADGSVFGKEQCL